MPGIPMSSRLGAGQPMPPGFFSIAPAPGPPGQIAPYSPRQAYAGSSFGGPVPATSQMTATGLLGRLRWLIAGPPNRAAGLGLQPMPQDVGGRIRWALFGPQNSTAVVAGQGRYMKPIAQAQVWPGAYGFIPSIKRREGEAVLVLNTMDRLPTTSYPLVNPIVIKSPLQPFLGIRFMHMMYYNWYPVAMFANTRLGWVWKAGHGGFTRPYAASSLPFGAQTGSLYNWRAAWRVPRYSTQPATIPLRDSASN